jgi:hypothetical protein
MTVSPYNRYLCRLEALEDGNIDPDERKIETVERVTKDQSPTSQTDRQYT